VQDGNRRKPGRSSNARKGNSLIEFSLLMPWYFFLFVGVYDFGFYSYSLMALEDGVRVAALNASQSTTNANSVTASTTACTYVLESLQNLPNVSGVTCPSSSSPLTVTETYGATSGPDSGPEATVTATYTSPQLIPIPGLLPSQTTTTRTVYMRVR
jgi:Flp pilus assembly protein TadG